MRVSETIHRFIYFIPELTLEFVIDQENYRLLSHTTELIVLNGNRGLKRLAEEGNESLHSIQRKTREQAARKFNLVAGDDDTFRFISNNTHGEPLSKKQTLQLVLMSSQQFEGTGMPQAVPL